METASNIVRPGYGILAADEVPKSMEERFKPYGIPNDEKHRRDYREIIFTTPKLNKYVSGIIMTDETMRQESRAGQMFPDLLKEKNIYTGILADKGIKPLSGTYGETYTEGLDGLPERCQEWYDMGARFAKWKADFTIQPHKGIPSEWGIQEQAFTLARYASICQDHGIVPIVEPMILRTGEHTIQESHHATERILKGVMNSLQTQRVIPEGILIKTAFVSPGSESGVSVTPNWIAQWSLRTYGRTIVGQVPGIVFLSKGLDYKTATEYLNACNANDEFTKPWALTYSFGRALLSECVKNWKGDNKNAGAAQKALIARCKANSQAAEGKYKS